MFENAIYHIDRLEKEIVRREQHVILRTYKRALRLFVEAVIDMTPVDTGKLINNWRSTRIPITVSEEIQAVNPSGRRALARVFRTINKVTFKSVFVFYNNARYAARIEYEGHSKQAPAGMIQINVRRWGYFLRRAKRGYGRR